MSLNWNVNKTGISIEFKPSNTILEWIDLIEWINLIGWIGRIDWID